MLSTQYRSSMNRLALRIVIACFSAGTLLLLAPPATAADTIQGGPAAQSPIPEQKLSAAAAAMERVVDLQQNYQQQLAAAPRAEQQRISGEASAALTKAVTDQGLTVDEYNGILQAAQSNPSVRDGLLKHMRAATPTTPSTP